MNYRILFVVMVGVVIVMFLYLKKDEQKERTLEGNMENKISFIKENGVNVIDYGVKGDGVTDDTEKFQFAIEDAIKKNKVLIVPAKTYLLSPLKYRDTTSKDWWCLNIPSNAEIYFESGSLLKLVEDPPRWTRVLVINEVSNVNLYGHIEVDGSADTVTNGNEHMAGIFIYDAQKIFIESAYSHDSFGDNIFVGGTEKNYSNNVKINYFKGHTAGRKNLVIHYVDNLHIGNAILDNSKGGEETHWTGENSLDLEPDNFKGRKHFYQRIDYLSTYGKGNDFTVGTKKKLADKWQLDIGNFNVILMDGPSNGLLSYGITMKIDRLFVNSTDANDDASINLLYSANWEVNEAYIMNGNSYAISAKTAKDEKPTLKIGKIFINSPNGKGLELWGADASIDYLEANTIQGNVLEMFSTNNQLVTIQNFISRNSGEEQIISISDYGFDPLLRIGHLFVTDNRVPKVESIVNLYTQKAVDGIEINNILNYDRLKVLSFGPSVTKKRLISN